MVLSLLERRPRQGQGRSRQPGERGEWMCDNCSARSAWPRKRCGECGTSRY